MIGSPISCNAMMSRDNDSERAMMAGNLRVKPQPMLNVAMRNCDESGSDGCFIWIDEMQCKHGGG